MAGVPYESLFAHHWYLAIDEDVNAESIKEALDEKLKKLNDDYAVERTAALKEVFVNVLPVNKFYEWMESRGKVGGQNKFPRVLKGALLEDWVAFIKK